MPCEDGFHGTRVVVVWWFRSTFVRSSSSYSFLDLFLSISLSRIRFLTSLHSSCPPRSLIVSFPLLSFLCRLILLFISTRYSVDVQKAIERLKTSSTNPELVPINPSTYKYIIRAWSVVHGTQPSSTLVQRPRLVALESQSAEQQSHHPLLPDLPTSEADSSTSRPS